MHILEEANYGVKRHHTHGSTDSRVCGNSTVTGVSPEQYRKINEFGLCEQSRHWATFGYRPSYDHQRGRKYRNAQFSEYKTTGKGLIYVPSTRFVSHQMGPLVTGRRKHWRGKYDHYLSHTTTLTRNTDEKILPYLYRIYVHFDMFFVGQWTKSGMPRVFLR